MYLVIIALICGLYEKTYGTEINQNDNTIDPCHDVVMTSSGDFSDRDTPRIDSSPPPPEALALLTQGNPGKPKKRTLKCIIS